MSYQESPQDREARIKRFKSLTDEEVEATIASDPDAQTPLSAMQGGGFINGKDIANDPDWYTHTNRLYPSGEMVVPLKLSAEIAAYLQQADMDYQTFLAGVMESFIESQQQT